MAKNFRLQCCWEVGSALPRDRICINPCFSFTGAFSVTDGFCQDLATALQTWATGSRHLNVKAYDLEGTPPVYPAAQYRYVGGGTTEYSVPREIALCLSFYSGQNIPRKRGRLYIPAGAFATATSMIDRPSSTLRTKVGDLAGIFAAAGGVDVDWIVWSQVTKSPNKVSNWWVDDEWDVMRSRGLKSTARTVGTTSG